jgi:3',5'-cyclic AMP phosphodiesterase CpdA
MASQTPNSDHRPAAVRIAHFSDIHVRAPRCAWKKGDWRSKRLSAWINFRMLGRGRRFGLADRILEALRDDWKSRGIDHVIFSGDASATGFEEEIARAAALLGIREEGFSGLAVPGNHDYCTRGDMAGGAFERHFLPWQQGQRVDGAVYPFAQRVGRAWLIGVNSSTANRWAWDARGRVGAEQLRRLERLLAQLDDGPRILVTHYPVCLEDGRPEKRFRGLRDLDDLIAVAADGGVRLWLHGHRHFPYRVLDRCPFHVVCAGSTTQHGAGSYLEYTLEGTSLRAQRLEYHALADGFRGGETFTLELS